MIWGIYIIIYLGWGFISNHDLSKYEAYPKVESCLEDPNGPKETSSIN